MTDLMKNLANGLKGRRTTARLESVVKKGKAARVTLAFNRTPTMEEITAYVHKTFNGQMEVIANTSILRDALSRVVVACFVKPVPDSRPLSETSACEEVATNIFMDESDQSIWKIQGDKLVKTVVADLESLLETAHVNPERKTQPHTVIARTEFKGVANSCYLTFFDEESAAVSFGVRVSPTEVYDGEHIVEVSDDCVIAHVYAHGQDATVATPVSKDAVALAEYYQQVYDFDADYFDMLQDIINSKTLG